MKDVATDLLAALLCFAIAAFFWWDHQQGRKMGRALFGGLQIPDRLQKNLLLLRITGWLNAVFVAAFAALGIFALVFHFLRLR